MHRPHIIEGRLPFSFSPDMSSTPRHQSSSHASQVATLCAALQRTQEKEKELMASIQTTLGRMNSRTPITPPHFVTTSPEVLTVDAKAAWSRSRSPTQPIAAASPLTPLHGAPSPSPCPPCQDCVSLHAMVQQLRRDNGTLQERQERLEGELEQLRSGKPWLPSDATPQRRMNRSNVLLHDSTHKLLAEAERALLMQDASQMSTFRI